MVENIWYMKQSSREISKLKNTYFLIFYSDSSNEIHIENNIIFYTSLFFKIIAPGG